MGDDRLRTDEQVDGPAPPLPKRAVGTDRGESDDLVAIHVAWWELPPHPKRARPDEIPNPVPYHSIAASVDGVHEPTLWPTKSTDTVVTGLPGRYGTTGEQAKVPFDESRGEVEDLVDAVLESGLLKSSSARQLERDAEGIAPQPVVHGWQVVLFYGDVFPAAAPTAARAVLYVDGWMDRDDPKRVAAQPFLDLLAIIHGGLWDIATPRSLRRGNET